MKEFVFFDEIYFCYVYEEYFSVSVCINDFCEFDGFLIYRKEIKLLGNNVVVIIEVIEKGLDLWYFDGFLIFRKKIEVFVLESLLV